MLFKSFVALSATSMAVAQLVPTGPTPGDSFREGGQCLIQFNPDTAANSDWQDTTISLMSGSNFNMVKVVDIVTGYDGTQGDGRIEFTCPQVTPNSQIYFYQFSAPGADVSWTGRFSITGADGQSTTPANSTTSNGQTIRFGFGRLDDPSQADVPLVSGSGSSAAASGSGSASESTAATSGTAGSASGAVSSAAMSSSPASSVESASSSSSTTSAPLSSSSSSASAASSASPSVSAGQTSVQATSGDSVPTVGHLMTLMAGMFAVGITMLA